MAQLIYGWVFFAALVIGIAFAQNEDQSCSCDQIRQCMQQKHDQMQKSSSTCEATCSKQFLNGATKEKLEGCKPNKDSSNPQQMKQQMDTCMKQLKCPSGSNRSNGARTNSSDDSNGGRTKRQTGFNSFDVDQSQFGGGGFGGGPPQFGQGGGGFGGGGFGGGQPQFGGGGGGFGGGQPQFGQGGGGFGGGQPQFGQLQFGGNGFGGGQPQFGGGGGFNGPPPGPPSEIMNMMGEFHNCMRNCMEKAMQNGNNNNQNNGGNNNNQNNGGNSNQNVQRQGQGQGQMPFGGMMGPPRGGPEMDMQSCASQIGCNLEFNVVQQVMKMFENCRPQLGNKGQGQGQGQGQRPEPPSEEEQEKSCECVRDLLGKTEDEVACKPNFNGGNFNGGNFNGGNSQRQNFNQNNQNPNQNRNQNPNQNSNQNRNQNSNQNKENNGRF